MIELKNRELKSLTAGSAGWVVAGIVAGITFLAGLLDGLSRPFKCR